MKLKVPLAYVTYHGSINVCGGKELCKKGVVADFNLVTSVLVPVGS